MRCSASRGNDLRSNRRCSPSAIPPKKRHIGAYRCVRNRTATTAECFEKFTSGHVVPWRTHHLRLEEPRTNEASDSEAPEGGLGAPIHDGVGEAPLAEDLMTWAERRVLGLSASAVRG